MEAKDFLVLAVVGVGLYALSRVLDVSQKATAALADVGSALGSGLFDLFHPDQVGETIFYTVTFPAPPVSDGQRHAVPSRSVSAQGVFTLPQFYGSQRWQIVIGKDNLKYAAKI